MVVMVVVVVQVVEVAHDYGYLYCDYFCYSYYCL